LRHNKTSSDFGRLVRYEKKLNQSKATKMARLIFKKNPPPESISAANWSSWRWQIQNSYRSQADFERIFCLTESEKLAFSQGGEIFNIRTTPYYANLCSQASEDPIRRILMPRKEELSTGAQQMHDPLGEKANSPVPRIIHRYSDRVLLLVTDVCSVYCRYCTRKHFTGQDQAFIKESELISALNYIRTRPGIREVILSGGDPLTLSDSRLESILAELRQIKHVEIIRLGTRMPVVCPQRIDESLVKLLRQMKPVYVMTHFNHPREVTEEAAIALELFVDHGIPVLNQMVLLNGVNNHPAIVQALSRRLLYLRVKPYYMFQCDPSLGTDHLRTSVEESMQIQRALWGHLSGIALPNLSLDIPNGGGKTVLVPNFQTSHHGPIRSYKGWDGVEANYVSPAIEASISPLDAEDYVEEWQEILSARSTQL
jgi:lysine 2,3-aminomutase